MTSVTAVFENRYSHRLVACETAPIMACLMTKSLVWGHDMIRILALLLVTAAWLAGAGPSNAQNADFRDFFGGGSNFGGGGSGPIPRTMVSFDGRYAPGTIVINTAERRLYLVQGNGEALRYGIG